VLELIPLTDSIGTEVRGVDVTGDITPATFDRIYEAWIDSTILLFRDQCLSPQHQSTFTRRFGEVAGYTRSQFSHEQNPEILVLSNIVQDGKGIGSPESGRVWHTDGHYLTDPPSGSVLHAIEVPLTGGDTWFANMFAAYDALPTITKQRLAGLKVVISRVKSRPYNYPDRPPPTAEERAEWADVTHPIVRRHEVNGRLALYAGGNVPWRIEGLPEDESRPLVTFAQEFSIQPRFTYRHKWRPGDIIVWDNRSAMHKATAYDQVDERRLMHRTTFSDLGLHPPASV
jgi:alpha-ketoglutarate-dependent taurine dioxygenase